MGKIVISENVTLDGVIQDPAGDEGLRVGGWVGLIKDSPQLNKLALDEALGAEPSESSRAILPGQASGKAQSEQRATKGGPQCSRPASPSETEQATRHDTPGSPGSGSYKAPAA